MFVLIFYEYTGKWIKAAEVPPNDCKGTVPHLDENTEYEFRVRAVNAAGPGKPSKASKTVITKPRKCKWLNNDRTYFMNYELSTNKRIN